MTTSRVPDVIDYLVTAFTAAVTLGAADPPVVVYDGPVVTLEPAELVLFVGIDDAEGIGAAVGATAEQQWAALGKMARDELLTVFCVAQAWSGDRDVRTARVAAFGIVAAVEDIVRGDAALGGLVQFVNPGVTGLTLRQNNTPDGAIAEVAFSINGKARIGG